MGKIVVFKYALFAFLMVILFVVLGFFVSAKLMQYVMEDSPLDVGPHLALARVIDSIDATDKMRALESFVKAQDSRFPMDFELIDEAGQVIFPRGSFNKYSPEILKDLKNAYDYKIVEDLQKKNSRRFIPPFGGPMPPPLPGMELSKGQRPPPPPGMPGMGPQFERKAVFVLLNGAEKYFLKIAHGRPQGPPPHERRWVGLIGFSSQLVSLLLGIGAALFFIYGSVAKKVKEADEVITQIQKGNLKARFEVKRSDEFGKAMEKFNLMADEIEILVERLKSSESNRTKLLQELAHDLRTPVASLKGVLETLQTRRQQLGEEAQQEFLNLSVKEVDYFARLVNDLLLLAQVSDAKFVNTTESIYLATVLVDELDDCEFRQKKNDIDFKVIREISDSDLRIFGNGNLLRRMIRNVLENACSFARSQISVKYRKDGSQVIVEIVDDGPGLSEEVLKNFGERKASRVVGSVDGGRLSVGLGSVVMKRICELHGGTMSVKNIYNERQEIAGALIQFSFSILDS